jgi:hypothetical protein
MLNRNKSRTKSRNSRKPGTTKIKNKNLRMIRKVKKNKRLKETKPMKRLKKIINKIQM